MECRTACYSISKKRQRGFTLVEILVASCIGLMLVLALCALSLYCGRSLAAISNYVEMDTAVRETLDIMTREFRQLPKVETVGTNSMVFLYPGDLKVTYSFDPSTQILTRAVEDANASSANQRLTLTLRSSSRANFTSTLLKGCVGMTFTLLDGSPASDTYELAETTDPAKAKAIRVWWKCSRSIMGVKQNTENITSAIIVLRPN